MRINKYLAHVAGYSRREADKLIEQGRVSIDGRTLEIGARVQPGDTVAIDNKPVQNMSTYSYVLFHKPVGYVCSRRAQGDAPTIYELLPKQYQPLKTVGRLDKDSSGLILLTDDGDFAHRMTHPKFHKTKVYVVELDHPLEPLHQQMISDIGIALPDGRSQFSITKLEDDTRTRLPSTPADRLSTSREVTKSEVQSWDTHPHDETVTSRECGQEGRVTGLPLNAYEVTMQEGRNRQIRRTFAALGYTVTKLHRTTFGPYSLGSLKPGHHEKTSAL